MADLGFDSDDRSVRPESGSFRGVRGGAALGFGAAILLALVLANVAAPFLDPNELEEGGNLADRPLGHPPHFQPLQRVLHESDVRVEPVSGSSGGLGAFGGGASTCQSDTMTVFRSRPPQTAVVGRTFSYRPEVATSDYVLEVDGPGFLSVDSVARAVTGTPTEADLGSTEVRVSAVDDDGCGAAQVFTLMVSRRAHPLGTTPGGGDLLVELVRGARYALAPGLVATLIGVGLGLVIGAHAGFFGGGWDWLGTRLGQGLEAVPALVLILLAGMISNFHLIAMMAAVGLVLMPEMSRSIRDRVASFRERQFVEAAREIGLPDRSILWSEIVWYNLRPLVIAQVARVMSLAILFEVTLSYLNLNNADAAEGSWGTLLYFGKQSLGTTDPEYWMIVFPALAIAVAVGGFRLLEMGLNARAARGGG